LIAADDYRRAVDLEPIRGSRLTPGRALDAGELAALFRACAANSVLQHTMRVTARFLGKHQLMRSNSPRASSKCATLFGE
jgi:hypothetical protein